MKKELVISKSIVLVKNDCDSYIGVISGETPNETQVLQNHRDPATP